MHPFAVYLLAVRNAIHALSIDDERSTFNPVYWPQRKVDEVVQQQPNDRIVQVWFAGMHSGVGGGYPKDGMSYVSLDWMLNQIEQNANIHPLNYKPSMCDDIKQQADTFDVMYDSRRALGMYYRYSPRNLLAIVNRTVSGDFVRELAIDESKSVLPIIHESVLQRIDGGGQDYLPLTLPHRFFVWHTAKEENNETDHIEVLSQLATEQDENNSLANLDKEIRNNRNYRKSFWRGFFSLSLLLLFLPGISYFVHLLKNTALPVAPDIPAFIRWILPDVLAPWVNWFGNHPYILGICIVLYVWLFWLRHKLIKNSKQLAYQLWQFEPAKVTSDIKSEERIKTTIVKKEKLGVLEKLDAFATKMSGLEY